jgi:molecular chaperone GrpE
MLPVVDNLERAIEHAASLGDKNPIVEGVQLVLRQFTTAFERLEVTQVEAMGKPFDPNMHEAISQAESDEPPGTVVQVLQRGYKSGDRLLRPALVVVAKAKAAAE